MGFPIDKLIVATNENDILSVFFETGCYARGNVHYTISPAMDIQVASNFERFLYYYLDRDSARLTQFMESFASSGSASLPGSPGEADFLAATVTQAETLDAIRRMHEKSGYIADPHTAVGLAAAERFSVSGAKICLATAHPAKFPESVQRAVDGDRIRHDALDVLKDLPGRATRLPATVDAVKEFLVENAR